MQLVLLVGPVDLLQLLGEPQIQLLLRCYQLPATMIWGLLYSSHHQQEQNAARLTITTRIQVDNLPAANNLALWGM